MLIDIYARSMLTATRQDCVPLRAYTPKPPRTKTPSRQDSTEKRPKHLLAKLTKGIKRLTLRRQPVQCLNPQKL